VIAARGGAQFVFDHHNMVYAYGDLDRYEARLAAAGFTPGSVAIPAPHSHNFHVQFDSVQRELMSYWEWTKCPLEPDDDD
jgi:hypothetical protein